MMTIMGIDILSSVQISSICHEVLSMVVIMCSSKSFLCLVECLLSSFFPRGRIKITLTSSCLMAAKSRPLLNASPSSSVLFRQTFRNLKMDPTTRLASLRSSRIQRCIIQGRFTLSIGFLTVSRPVVSCFQHLSITS